MGVRGGHVRGGHVGRLYHAMHGYMLNKLHVRPLFVRLVTRKATWSSVSTTGRSCLLCATCCQTPYSSSRWVPWVVLHIAHTLTAHVDPAYVELCVQSLNLLV